MARIKHTKNELKAQREALARFERFLPMLQLKKQQLQVEIQHIDARIADNRRREAAERETLARWVKLLSEPGPLEDLVRVDEIVTSEGNIAGVSIPIFETIRFKPAEMDLFLTPPWFDAAVETLTTLTRLRAENEVYDEQRRLVAEELRVTTQRVNLFEKVKIPECRENIRVIRIFLGDQQTAAVARAKLAKNRAA